MYAQKNYNEIPLCVRGKQVAVALVDSNVFELVKNYSWKLNSNGYAYRNTWENGKAGTMYMHRFIMNNPAGKVVDHINHNKLDNRMMNLRACEHKENIRNSKLSKNNTSGVSGVVWHKTQSSWQARIKVNYKTIFLGYFKKFDDAVAVRKDAEKKYFGEFTTKGAV